MFGELPKTYDPQQIETQWAKTWAESGWFVASLSSAAPAWSLVIPPPNVTGSLHMGHMLEHSQIDAIVRWRRMSGFNVLWLPGTDHAGIATQMVVERELLKEGTNRKTLGREKFVERVWQWKAKSGDTIHKQMVRIGDSCDWSRERFTLDEGLSRAVREVFVSLYEEGLLYRGRYIVNWCPRCQTAISDLEVVHKETQGKLYHIRYPVIGSDETITVATTRPETMLGDTAVAVNPSDSRYQHLVGRRVRLPLLGREIPIIADELAQPEFGTGAVKVTPAHDPNDFLAGQRHQLPQIVVIDETGHMTAEAGKYAGLERFQARKQVLDDLEAAGLLVKIDEHHPMAIGHCQRCGSVIEPRLSTQWFVRIEPLARDAIRVVEDGLIEFQPETYRGIYLRWMYNIHDWCISRQLWWGHRIPAWYCGRCGETIVSRQDPESCKCGGPVQQDPDVLDTWFSSGLWPFSTLGWPEHTADLEKFYPTSLMITGFDILFFWVARMIMLGVHFTRRDGRTLGESVPFRQVYIHALVRDAEKQKMSKTKGNVTDPLALIDKYGTDAVRFTLSAMAAPGTDIVLSEKRMEGYQAFANKIWNAARFIFSTLDRLEGEGKWHRKPGAEAQGGASEHPLDRWIFSRLDYVASRVNDSLAGFRFHEAADTLYHFFWHEFCDWYLELVKIRLSGGDTPTIAQAADSLAVALETALRLLHPFMPFITEELWQRYWAEYKPRPSIALMPFPQPIPEGRDSAAERELTVVQQIITDIRSVRAEWKIAPKTRLNLKLAIHDRRDGDLSLLTSALRHLAGIDEVQIVPAISDQAIGRMSAPGYDLQLNLRGAINVSAERARLQKESDAVRRSLDNARQQLASGEFRARAPEAIVRELERKQDELGHQLSRLQQSLNALNELAHGR